MKNVVGDAFMEHDKVPHATHYHSVSRPGGDQTHIEITARTIASLFSVPALQSWRIHTMWLVDA